MMDRHGQRPMILAQFVMAILVAVVATEDDDSVKLEKVSILSGRTAELPCDITPPTLDSLYLVLWYKNNSDFPIYKYDARRSRESYRQQEIQRDNQMFLLQQQQQQHGQESSAGRIHFQFDSHPALLLLSNVGDPDEGDYRCRVDFGRSPTRNVLVQLTVVVPPQKIRIIEDNRQVSSVIGPYDEGDQLSLNCIVTGGRPRPEVSWWLNDKLVDHTYMATSENVVQNILVIPQLERHHLHAILRCKASNYFGVHNNTPPFAVQSYGYKKPKPKQQQHSPSSHHSRHPQHTIVSSVQLDLNLRPLWVLINGAEKPLSVGKSYTFECITGGSRPSVNVRWYLHSIQQPSKERVTMDGSNTTSILNLMPTAKDHDAELICLAVNPVLPVGNASIGNNGTISSVETRRRLIVHFAPTAELELGRNLKPDLIVEGNDVYFECRVNSNPLVQRFVWTHEGQTIRENAAAGVIIVEQSLVIRRVSRSHSGRYSCTAVNTEGSGVSNTVQLRVMFQPVCRPGQKILYGVAKHETVVVQCQTDAIPPAHSHRWAFNTSLSDVVELQDNQMFQTTSPIEEGAAEADGTSVISYSPQSDRDYGSLICWARNVIGEQREPCVYRIFLGVRPDPPSNCSVLNQTAEAVEVWCRPGFDGGHPQLFQFEIFDTQSAVLLYNKSGRYPHLRVGNLESGIKLFIQVSAFNQRGRSPLVPLEAYTIKIADKQTVIMETTDWASILGITGGISAAILIVYFAIAVTYRSHRQSLVGHHPNKTDNRLSNLKITTNPVDQHNNDDPDIIINSNSVQEQRSRISTTPIEQVNCRI
ncbi:hemicentin-1-like isoform X3 [Daphnia pulex]|uniref:hemicentin-1-like isoform X3 n=1 Tax=Daphnia pulex TaxID=6669 RepID=UPI001EDF1BF1|nr:hemicentin-1-like isoform X3 [Daphnia pulex]